MVSVLGPRLVIVALALSGLTHAAPNPKLQSAKRLMDVLRFDAAARMLEKAAEVPGNEPAEVVEIFELQGIVWGSLGANDKAQDAFEALLLLKPEYELAPSQSPRVRAPFTKAKAQVAGRALKVEAEVMRGSEVVEALSVKVTNNQPRLGRVVAFHLVIDGRETTTRVPLDETSRAKLKVGAASLRWWVELLGPNDAVVAQVGTASAPREEQRRPVRDPVVPVEPDKGALAAWGDEPAPAAPTWVRPTGIALLAVGVAGVGAGVVCGAVAQGARAQLEASLRPGDVTTALTQRQAVALDAQATGLAPVANVLFITGGALAAAGVTLTVVAGTSSVALSPTPGGVQVSGRF